MKQKKLDLKLNRKLLKMKSKQQRLQRLLKDKSLRKKSMNKILKMLKQRMPFLQLNMLSQLLNQKVKSLMPKKLKN